MVLTLHMSTYSVPYIPSSLKRTLFTTKEIPPSPPTNRRIWQHGGRYPEPMLMSPSRAVNNSRGKHVDAIYMKGWGFGNATGCLDRSNGTDALNKGSD